MNRGPLKWSPTQIVTTFPPRQTLEAVRPDLAALIPVTIALGFACLQGDVLGLITASGKYRRRSRTLAAGAGFGIATTDGVVADASVFAPGDVLTKSDGTAIGTIAAGGVNTVTNHVTLTANAANAMAAGVAIIATDGSAVSQGIADDGSDGTSDTVLSMFISGLLFPLLCRGLDATAQTDLAGSTRAGVFVF